MPIFCCDCYFYRRYDENWASLDACVHPSLPEKRDRVRGEPMAHYCSDVRSFSGPCGPDGKLFQAKSREDVEYFTLDKLQYSTNRKGLFKLYVYRADGFHGGGVWFRPAPKNPVPLPSDEITPLAAHARTLAAKGKGREVRICDGGDFLVFHAKGGKVLYGENFFQEIADAPVA